jgi:uncharacterized membrane protein YtjA (UPF0391 family)
MLGWAIMFFFMSIVAAIVGMSGLTGTFIWMAEWFFIVFALLFIGILIANIFFDNDRRPPI